MKKFTKSFHVSINDNRNRTKSKKIILTERERSLSSSHMLEIITQTGRCRIITLIYSLELI